jgi:hypothetical protein
MKKIIWLLPILAILLIAGSEEPTDLIRFTVINKAEREATIQLQAIPQVCCNIADVKQGEFYYLTVPKGDKDKPITKTNTIAKDTYRMYVFYKQTYDPVYGFKCDPTVPNTLMARRNLRLVLLPCGELPTRCAIGEPSMWKYIPYPVKQYAFFRTDYWLDRLIY